MLQFRQYNSYGIIPSLWKCHSALVKERLFAENILQSNIFDHKKYETYYNEYLEFGGFPGVVVAKDIEE